MQFAQLSLLTLLTLFASVAHGKIYTGVIQGKVVGGTDQTLNPELPTIFGFADDTNLAGMPIEFRFRLDTTGITESDDLYNTDLCGGPGGECDYLGHYADESDGVVGNELSWVQLWMTLNGVTLAHPNSVSGGIYVSDESGEHSGNNTEFFEIAQEEESHYSPDSLLYYSFRSLALQVHGVGTDSLTGDSPDQLLSMLRDPMTQVGGSFSWANEYRDADGELVNIHSTFGHWQMTSYTLREVSEPSSIALALLGCLLLIKPRKHLKPA